MTTKKDIVRNNNIADLRKKKGYSQISFAEKIGVRNDSLNKIENGKARPSLSLSIKIADKLGVKLDDLFLK